MTYLLYLHYNRRICRPQNKTFSVPQIVNLLPRIYAMGKTATQRVASSPKLCMSLSPQDLDIFKPRLQADRWGVWGKFWWKRLTTSKFHLELDRPLGKQEGKHASKRWNTRGEGWCIVWVSKSHTVGSFCWTYEPGSLNYCLFRLFIPDSYWKVDLQWSIGCK